MKKITTKTFQAKKMVLSLCYLSGVITPLMTSAEEPSWEILPAYKNTVVVSQPTEKLLGHSPGIETFPLVKKSMSGKPDILELCDTLKINYRILDKDGDWADTKAISENVQWFVFIDDNPDEKYYLVSNDSTDTKKVPFDNRYRDFEDSTLTEEEQALALTLLDHIKLVKDDPESGRIEGNSLRAFIVEQKANNKRVKLGYSLWPKTVIGEPFESSKRVEVLDFSKTTILNPQVAIDEDQLQSTGENVQDIFDNYDLGRRFYKYSVLIDNVLEVGANDCALPPPLEGAQFIIGYYLIDEENTINTQPVNYLASGNKFEVKFFYDKNKNNRIDVDLDEDVTQLLLADDAKDYLGRPFINGLRIDLSFNLRGVNLNSYEDTSDQNNNSIFISPTVIDKTGIVASEIADPSSAVSARGIALDAFRSTDSSQFFWIEDSFPLKALYFKSIEGEQIPDEILDEQLAPKVLKDYFKVREDALSLQGFKINVRASYPYWPNDFLLESSLEGDSQ